MFIRVKIVFVERVMKSLAITKIDDHVFDGLVIRAKKSGRSLEDEARMILTAAVLAPAHAPTSREFKAIAERIAAMTPDVPQSNSTELIRQQRDA